MELLSDLELIEPALAAHQIVPIMTHFCFTGSHVAAYNDALGIAVPCETEFTGAVPGATLLKLLHASRKRDLVFEQTKQELQLGIGKGTNSKLSILPDDQFILPDELFAKPDPATHLPLDLETFMKKVGVCLISTGMDTGRPEQLGITIEPDTKSSLMLYATNDKTLSRALLDLKKGTSVARSIIPTPFCKQVLRLAPRSKKTALYLADDHCLFTADDVTVYSRLHVSDKPLDYKGLFEHHMPPKIQDILVETPAGLKWMIERAIVITDDAVDQVSVSIEVDNGSLHFESRSARGEVIDDTPFDHPNIGPLYLFPKLLKVGIDHYNKIAFTKKCAILAQDDCVYMISVSTKA